LQKKNLSGRKPEKKMRNLPVGLFKFTAGRTSDMLAAETRSKNPTN